jgi:hypothetical protein
MTQKLDERGWPTLLREWDARAMPLLREMPAAASSAVATEAIARGSLLLPPASDAAILAACYASAFLNSASLRSHPRSAAAAL